MTAHKCKVLVDGPGAGSYNMAVEEVLLAETAEADSGLTYLRFFQWVQPTLSLGFSQKPGRVINWGFCRQNRIECVKRITGGKAVLHHKELTYSIVSNDSALFPFTDIGETYSRIARALVLGFGHLGIETVLAGGPNHNRGHCRPTAACFATANHHEILWESRKLVGSAQRRTKTAFLQHGSILFDFDSEMLAGALLQENPSELRSQVASLKQCLGTVPKCEEVISCLKEGFIDFFGVQFKATSLNLEKQRYATELACSKYAPLKCENETDLPIARQVVNLASSGAAKMA